MMEFWGVEVKSGETLNCDPGFDKYLHISQAALGEIQNTKENERVQLYVHARSREFLIGTLTYGKCDQISLDIVFDKEFKLSHSCRKGSVFFCGYTTVIQGDEVSGSDEEGSSSESSDSESDDDKQAQALKHTLGKTEAKPDRVPVIKSAAKPAKAEAVTVGKADKNVKAEEVKALGEESMDEDEDESEDEDDKEMGDSSDEDGSDESGDASDENKSEKAPKAEPAAKKRPLPDSTTKSLAKEKKTKVTAAGGVEKTGTDEGKKAESKMIGGKPGLSGKPPIPSSEVQASKVKSTPDAKETPKTSAKPGTEKKVGVYMCNTCSSFLIGITRFWEHKEATWEVPDFQKYQGSPFFLHASEVSWLGHGGICLCFSE